jgi:uncharacterized protein (DUF433 family)
MGHTGDEDTHYIGDGCNPPHELAGFADDDEGEGDDYTEPVADDHEGEGDDYTEPVADDPRYEGQCRWWDTTSERCPILRNGDGPFCQAHAKRFNAILWFADIRVELPDAFFETDEPIDDVIAVWNNGENVVTAKSSHGTSGGVELTDDLINRLADEAEQGYDPTTIRPRGETPMSGRHPNSDELARKISAAAVAAVGDAQLWPISSWSAVNVAAVAALREIETVLNDWTDEDYRASDALDVVADAADAIEGGPARRRTTPWAEVKAKKAALDKAREEGRALDQVTGTAWIDTLSVDDLKHKLTGALNEIHDVEELLCEGLRYRKSDGGPDDPNGGGYITGEHTAIDLATEARQKLLQAACPRITHDPAVLDGQACIRGLRITAEAVRIMMRTMTDAEILHDFPDLEGGDLRDVWVWAGEST